MTRSNARLRLVVSGVVVSVAIHALLLGGLALIPEPDKEPDCPTQREVCRAVCLAKLEPVIPEACPEPPPCECELVAVEPIPAWVALPTPAPIAPEVAPLPPVAPELVAPEPVPPEPVPPEPPPEPASADAGPQEQPAKTKTKKAEAAARSVAIAKVLGSYGDGDVGTVFDVIESGEDNLGELFAQGMTTTVAASDGRIAGASALVAGADADPELTKDPLADAIRRKLRSLRKCHTRETAEAGVEGKLAITLTYDDTGTPTKVVVDSDTTGSEELRACVVARVESWRLPADSPGDVSFTVVFALG